MNQSIAVPSLPTIDKQPIQDLAIGSLEDALKKASSFNGLTPLNASVIKFLSSRFSQTALTPAQAEDLYQVGRFALLSQNFCSPLVSRPNGLNQTGLFHPADHAKYLRSETGAAAFGLPYDRNQILIRKKMAESFRNLSASYMTPQGREMVQLQSASFAEPQKLLSKIKELSSLPTVGVVYLQDNGTSTDSFEEIVSFFKSNSLDTALIVERQFHPAEQPEETVLEIRLYDAGLVPLRYQMLQDAASMGYRPYLSSVFDYYARSGSLKEKIHDAPFVARQDIFNRRITREESTEDFEERIEDFRLLEAVITQTEKSLEGMNREASLVYEFLYEATLAECRQIQEEVTLQLEHAETRQTVPLASFAYHDLYTRIRSALQYTGFLQSVFNPQPQQWMRRDDITSQIELYCNAGMTATRIASTLLLPKVSAVYSTPHYWETDFLIENFTKGNPHFARSNEESTHSEVLHPTVVSLVPESSTEILADIVQQIIAHDADPQCRGQLLCVDALISPFFYTKRFDLAQFTSLLVQSNHKFQHPLYFLVDNTLDPYESNAEGLFPQGLPSNMFLIETTSLAKLHQFGFDVVTGGRLRGTAAQEDYETLAVLVADMAAAIQQEDSAQSPYGQAVLDSIFLAVGDSLQGRTLLKHMDNKRRRNSTLMYTQVKEYFDIIESSTGQAPLASNEPLVIANPVQKDVEHKVGITFHYEPSSGLHLYLRLHEEQGPPFIAGIVFERLKDRIIDRCFSEGILIGDGTSWGFRNTRIDWYMHTMRIATGLEHRTTVNRIGAILAEELAALCEDSSAYVTRRHGVKLSNHLRLYGEQAKAELNELLKIIPHDPERFQDIEFLLRAHPHMTEHSFLAIEKGEIVGLLIGYPTEDGRYYISKAATRPDVQGQGILKELLDKAETSLRAAGIEEIFLETSASQKNENVIHAYQNCGFSVSEEFETTWLLNGWPLIMATMTKSLHPQEGTEIPVSFAGVAASEYQRLFEERAALNHIL